MLTEPGVVGDQQEILEQKQDLQKTKEILLEERQDIEKTSRVILGLAERLLGGADKVSRIPSMLGKDPIRVSVSSALRDPFFKRIEQEFQRKINQAYEMIWLLRAQSLCGRFLATAYNTVEKWLRQRVLTDSIRRPGVKLSLFWFVAAVHNWTWWLTNLKDNSGGRTVSRSNGVNALKLESDLQVDVDPFLILLEESNCCAADLIAIHLMAIQLQRWMSPPRPGSVGVSLVRKSGIKVDTPMENPSDIPDQLANRWDRIKLISPVSRLLMATIPHDAAKVAKSNLPWNWIDTLFGDPGTGSIRQYLCSELGKWLSHPQTSPEHIHSILQILEQLSGEVVKHRDKPDVEDGWQYFLAEILWATLDNIQPQNMPLLWDRWAEEGSELVPLARWCGRLAYCAERLAQRTPYNRLPEWVWVWYDLARVTVGRWLIGSGKAISCLGLWLEGYIEEDHKTIPPLVLGQRAFKHQLDEIIAHWHGVSRVAKQDVCRQYEDLSEQKDFIKKMNQLAERLGRLQAITSYTVEEAEPESLNEASIPASKILSENDISEIAARARIYRYTRRTKGVQE